MAWEDIYESDLWWSWIQTQDVPDPHAQPWAYRAFVDSARRYWEEHGELPGAGGPYPDPADPTPVIPEPIQPPAPPEPTPTLPPLVGGLVGSLPPEDVPPELAPYVPVGHEYGDVVYPEDIQPELFDPTPPYIPGGPAPPPPGIPGAALSAMPASGIAPAAGRGAGAGVGAPQNMNALHNYYNLFGHLGVVGPSKYNALLE
ncbi:MAG: hypothetical protein E3J94_07110 [Desulfobacteraceae bacterium]|nr:MAG: hypothetical protein E3J94_07110 [Desulfobacteraceae bacterium]